MATENDPLIASTLAAALLGRFTQADMIAAKATGPQIAAKLYFDCVQAVQAERTKRRPQGRS